MGKGRGAVGRKGFSFFYAAKGNDRHHASFEGGWLLKVIFLFCGEVKEKETVAVHLGHNSA